MTWTRETEPNPQRAPFKTKNARDSRNYLYITGMPLNTFSILRLAYLLIVLAPKQSSTFTHIDYSVLSQRHQHTFVIGSLILVVYQERLSHLSYWERRRLGKLSFTTW
jgi:hypothetical protein